MKKIIITTLLFFFSISLLSFPNSSFAEFESEIKSINWSVFQDKHLEKTFKECFKVEINKDHYDFCFKEAPIWLKKVNNEKENKEILKICDLGKKAFTKSVSATYGNNIHMLCLTNLALIKNDKTVCKNYGEDCNLLFNYAKKNEEKSVEDYMLQLAKNSIEREKENKEIAKTNKIKNIIVLIAIAIIIGFIIAFYARIFFVDKIILYIAFSLGLLIYFYFGLDTPLEPMHVDRGGVFLRAILNPFGDLFYYIFPKDFIKTLYSEYYINLRSIIGGFVYFLVSGSILTLARLKKIRTKMPNLKGIRIKKWPHILAISIFALFFIKSFLSIILFIIYAGTM